MSTQTPDDPPPYVMGPGPEYDPPPIADLTDPEIQTRTRLEGRELVLAVLASKGRRKVDGKWTCTTPANEENER